MTVLEIVAVCVLPYLVVARMAAGHAAHVIAAHYPQQHGVPDGGDWFIAMICGVSWPAWCAAELVRAVLIVIFHHTPKVGAEARHLKVEREKRMRVAVAARAEALRAAEKQLGIGEGE